MLDEASQAVQFSRDLLQTTLDNIDQGVIVEQGEAKALFANPQQERTRQFLSKFLGTST